MSMPVVPGATGPVGSPARGSPVARSPGSASPASKALTQPQEQKIVQDLLDCINDLKSEFEESRIPINDDNQQLQRFCAKLEYLLQGNMKERKNMLGRRKDYWDYFCDCLGSTKGISDGIRYVKSLGEYKTSLGKGRAFLRFCLVHNRMADSLQACIVNGKATSAWFYPESIWLHQDRNNVLINALYDLCDTQFDLAPRGYDLDNAWPSFARKNLGAVHNWSLSSRSRTSSISSLISIPGQEPSPHKFGLSTTPSDYGDIDQMSISESVQSELKDKIDALEQQKSVFQQSVAHTQGEMDVLNQQLADFKAQNQQLTKDYSDLKHKYDRILIEKETKEKDWEVKENEHAQKGEEIEKLFEQIMSLEDKLQSQKELLNDSERQKTELQFEVKNLHHTVDSNKTQFEKKEEDLKCMQDKLQKQEDKNQELLQKVENLLLEKNNEASSQIDSVSKLQDSLVALKEAESENLKLGSEVKEKDKKYAALQTSFDEKCKVLENLEGNVKEIKGQKEALEMEVDKFTEKERESLASIKKLELELENMKSKLTDEQSSHEAELTSMKNKIGDLNSSFSDLKEKLENKNSEYNQAHSESEKLQAENLNLNNSIQKLNEEIEKLKNENERIDKENTGKITSLQTSLSEKEKNIEILEEKLQKSECERTLFENTVKEKSDQIHKLENDLSESDNKNHVLESKCHAFEKDLESLKECQQIEKGSTKEIKVKLEEKMDLVKNLELQMNEVKVMMELLLEGDKISDHTQVPEILQSTEIGNILSKMMESTVSKTKTINELTIHKDQQSCELDQLIKKIETKGRQLEELKSSVDDSEKTKVENEQKYMEEKDILEKKIALISEQCELKDKEIAEVRQQKETFEQEKNHQVSKCSELDTSIHEISEKLATKESELTSVQEKLMQSNETKEKLESEIQLLQEKGVAKDTEIAELREKSSRTENVLRQKSEMVENESSQVVKLKEQLTGCEKCVQDLQTNVAQLNTEIEKRKKNEAELKDLNENLEKEKKDLQVKMSELQQRLSNESKTLKEESEKLHIVVKEKSNLEQKIKELKEKQFDLEQKLKTSTKENENTQVQNQKVLNKLEVERHNLKQHLEDALKDIESIKQQLTQTCTELNEAYTEKERLEMEKKDLLTKQTEVAADLEKVQEEKNSLSTNVGNLQVKISELSSQCSEFEQKSSSLEVDNEKLQENVVELRNEIEQLTTRNHDSEQQIQNRQAELENLCEQIKQLESERIENKEEKENLNERLKEIQSELMDKMQECSDFQMAKDKAESELGQLQEQNDQMKLSTTAGLEKLNSDHEQEIEELKQEITSLNFQLSAEQIKFEQTAQTFSEQDTSISYMRDKIGEQEELIIKLEQEMSEIKGRRSQEQDKQEHELEELARQIACIDEEKKEVESKLLQVSKELETEKMSVVSLQTKLKEEELQRGELCKDKDNEVAQLKEDTKQLKKKLIKLIREKDSLWQKKDELSYQQKMAAKDKWLDEKTVSQCMLCQTEFSFTIRKHHCRFCGKVFCYQCSDNWIQTTHSSKKSRACKTCYSRVKSLEEDDGTLQSEGGSNSDLEETVEIPKMHKPRGVMNESTSSTISAASTNDSVSQTSEDKSMKESDSINIPGQVATAITVSMVDGNIPDEEKEKQKEKDDIFQVISEEEVSKSMTESGHPFLSSDPNMTTSVTISTDDLEKGQINSQNEVWIKPGKQFAVPILVDRFNTTLCWEFCSYPKDVVFGVHYQTMTGSSSEILIPPCKVDSHKQKVKGELTAKQLGVYSLMFDNSYSRLTSKKITYSLWTSKAN